MKRLFFFSILAAPALFLTIIIAYTAWELYEIHSLDPSVVQTYLQNEINQRLPYSFPLPENIFRRETARSTVFIFGESSLVLSDGGVFPDYLEKAHNDLVVVNFGISAINSLAVRQRVWESLSVSRPDLIILYYGHNDYNVTYQVFILPTYFDKFNPLLRLAYLFSDRNKPAATFANPGYEVFARLQQPRLFQVFQQLGLMTFDRSAYSAIDRLILDEYIRNNEAILDMAASAHIPVVLITPVGNLHAEPFGDIRTTTEYYRKGMAAKDYREAIAYLKKARDSEFFTYDLRAKSALVDYIRKVRRPDVYVLDLEKTLEDRGFGFGNADFVDYFHFNDKSHRLLADIIYDFMKQNKLVGNAPKKGRTVYPLRQ